MIRKLGSDPEKLFTYDNMQEQIRLFGKYIGLWAPIVVQVMLTDMENVKDLDELCKEISNKNENVVLVTGMSAKCTELYRTRIRGILDDLLKLNLN